MFWGGKDGRKNRSSLTVDGQKMLVESLTYYLKYTDEYDQTRIENSESVEKDVAQQVLWRREKRVSEIKAGILDPVKEYFGRMARRTIEEHKKDFVQYIKDKGCSKNHVRQVRMHLGELIEWAEAKRFCQITRDQVTRFIGHLRTSTSPRPRYGHETRSARTINSYLITIKSFTRWMYESRRCEVDPLTT